MKVSIITACRNSAPTLEGAIQSLLAQDYPEVEYILVDGCSNDGTAQILERYKAQIHKLISEPDGGLYDALNKGITAATGDIVGHLNADDLYAKRTVLSTVMRTFIEKKTDTVYGDLNYVDAGDITRIRRKWVAGPYDRKNFLKGWMPPHPAFFVRRETYLNDGMFNTGFRISADYELMLRLLYCRGITSAYIPEVLVTMRTGGLSNRSLLNRIQANAEDRKAWTLNGVRPGLFTLWRKPLSKLGQWAVYSRRRK